MFVDELGHDGDGHGGRRGAQDVLDLRILEFFTQEQGHVLMNYHHILGIEELAKRDLKNI